jgi:hypothetical protein
LWFVSLFPEETRGRLREAEDEDRERDVLIHVS